MKAWRNQDKPQFSRDLTDQPELGPHGPIFRGLTPSSRGEKMKP
jgi:hypothetical protein